MTTVEVDGSTTAEEDTKGIGDKLRWEGAAEAAGAGRSLSGKCFNLHNF